MSVRHEERRAERATAKEVEVLLDRDRIVPGDLAERRVRARVRERPHRRGRVGLCEPLKAERADLARELVEPERVVLVLEVLVKEITVVRGGEALLLLVEHRAVRTSVARDSLRQPIEQATRFGHALLRVIAKHPAHRAAELEAR